VIVAVIVVRMVQVARHNIIDMIAVLDGLVTAGRAMLVFRFVLLAVVVRRAVDRVRRGDRDFAHLRLHLHSFSSLRLGSLSLLPFAVPTSDDWPI
jgi:hypothetical protein